MVTYMIAAILYEFANTNEGKFFFLPYFTGDDNNN